MPTRRLGIALGLATMTFLGACASPSRDESDDDFDVSEGELNGSDDEDSFSNYDATSEELAAAEGSGQTSFDNELTLFAIPAPKLTGLSWKNPGGLARRTLISNGLGLSRSLGHAIVRVQCGATNTEPAGHFQGSMVDTDDTFRTMVLKEKAGLGVLLRTVPGAVESEADGQKSIDERYENGRVTFVRFAVSSEVCHGLLGYAQEFERLEVGKEYGFVRPLFKEGAGCSAFSMAFLELANLDEARFRNAWGFDVRIPMTLIGGRDHPSNKVSVFELFFSTRGWAKESEPHRRLVGWDPTKMYTSIRTMAKASLRDHAMTVEKRGRSLGLVLDRRNVTPRPTLASRTYWAGEPGAPRDFWGFGDP
jgi:hypothetical protein